MDGEGRVEGGSVRGKGKGKEGKGKSVCEVWLMNQKGMYVG